MDDIAKTGRVIAVAGSLETLLELHGARGTGLREKTESLRDKLPPEALELSRRVGMVRNRVAHDPETSLSDAELLEYEETARRFARMIEWPDLAEASPPPERDRLPDDAADKEAKEAKEAKPEPVSVSAEPEVPPRPPALRAEKRSSRFPRAFRAFIPGVHLLVLARELLRSLLPGWWYWILFFTLPLGGAVGWYGWCNRSTLPTYWPWVAAGWLATGWLGSVVTAFSEKKEHPYLVKMACLPVIHFLYLFARIIQSIRYGLFLAALTGLAAQGAAVFLVLRPEPEWLVAALLTLGSFIAAFLLAFFREP